MLIIIGMGKDRLHWRFRHIIHPAGDFLTGAGKENHNIVPLKIPNVLMPAAWQQNFFMVELLFMLCSNIHNLLDHDD